MKKRHFLYLMAFQLFLSCGQQEGSSEAVAGDGAAGGKAVSSSAPAVKQGERLLATPDGLPAREVAVDSMDMKNPFVMYEPVSNMYYMTGDGGCMWTSSDMVVWKGPFKVIDLEPGTWMGDAPAVCSPEIYKHEGKYCMVASFGLASEGGGSGDRSALSVLFADNITGPYRLAEGALPLNGEAGAVSGPTYTDDCFGNTCIVYKESAGEDGKPNVKIMMLAKEQKSRLGEPFGILDTGDLPWKSNVIESPDMFVTDDGGFGMLFESEIDGRSVIGAAYSTKELGHPLNGPWIVEPEPFVDENSGGASMFADYDGTTVLVMHKETVHAGQKRYVPHFMKMETQFLKLQNKGYYKFKF